MHFGPTAFAADLSKDTIEVIGGGLIGQRKDLSEVSMGLAFTYLFIGGLKLLVEFPCAYWLLVPEFLITSMNKYFQPHRPRTD